MIIPQFIRFYGYTATEVMQEYAVTFFALVNAMYGLKSTEMLEAVYVGTIPNMEKKDAENAIDKIKQGSLGLEGYLEQARNIRNVK